MNKFGVVLGIAAVATLAGCKDPDFKRSGGNVQNQARDVETAPVVAEPVESVRPVAVEPEVRKCTCPPGTKHTSPCTCGAPDCKCIVETRPVVVADVSKKPAEQEYTIYVVQNGDYLAKVSKRFNVTINSIKRLNPSIKNDVIFVGQKLKLPGKIDVGAKSAVAATSVATGAKGASAKKASASYSGATKEYVVKNGDTLGAIAYGNGINIRQLKELNGLASDSLKIGQKLKVPATKTAAAAKKTDAKPAVADAKPADVAKPDAEAKPAADASKLDAAAESPAVKENEPAKDDAPVQNAAEGDGAKAGTAAEPAKAEAVATTTYVVQEGDDMTGVSIRWGVSAAEIRELNNMADGDQLVPGQIIKLPADAQQ